VSAPLILAIQPDRRQQSQLASIARQVSAELLLTESVERAIAVLAERLPDLILTPTLLSHKDETALTERLREFGDVGAHIHTLTIPILETASPSRKGGVLSSLRKQKRKGKSPVTAGCTVDTFAEQISIYLNGAVEARAARRPIEAPRPAATFEAEPSAGETTADSLWSVEELPAETSAASVSPPEELERRPVDAATGDGLPTIEELSARTPPVPEPATPVEMRMNAIAVMAPSVSTLPVPAASVETGVTAIAAIKTGLSVRAGDCPMPMPAVAPRVAELAMELPPAQLAPGVGAVAMPLPAPVETGMEAVTAMVPLVSAPAVQAPLLTPLATPRVAELSVTLPAADATGHAPGSAIVLPAPPSGALEMSMATVAAMVPVVKAAHARPLPIPAVMSPLVELRMELPAHAAPARVAVPTVPQNGSSVSVEAIAAMASVADAATADRLAPLPADTPFTAELSLRLPTTDVAAHAIAPVAPESSRSVELNMQAVAHIAPAITDQTLVPLPATAIRVSELSMELPPSNAHPGVVGVPELPAISADTSMDAVAAMMPMTGAVSHHRPVPVPATLPYVMQLPMTLPSLGGNGSVDPRMLVVPGPDEPRLEAGMEAATATAGASATDAVAPAVSTAVMLAGRKRAKKKATLHERKAARKQSKKLTADPPADDSSLFDPDEVRFSALIAKLDEVALQGDEARESNAGRQGRTRKPAKSKRR
jgi:CheY-like chemotaxis protein